jgi:hypothetical protein
MHKPTQESSGEGFAVSRRTLLRGGASVAALSGLAGCSALDGLNPSQIQSYRYTALPVDLERPPEGLAVSGTDRGTDTVTRNPSLAGVGVEVTVTNHYAVFESAAETIGMISTPLVDIPVSGPANPLASKALRDLLAGPTGERLLRTVDVVDSPDLTWMQGPTRVHSMDATLLGTDTQVLSFAGIIEGEGFYLVNATRVEDQGDAVMVVTVLRREGTRTSLVGTDGYVTADEVTASARRLADLLGLVEHGGDIDRAGDNLRIRGSSQIETEPGSPNYLRVRIENWGGKRLTSVMVVAHLGAGRDLARMQTGQVQYLDPGEVFEGYLPYHAEGVDEYFLEGYASNRVQPTAAPSDVSVLEEALTDTADVVGTVRNTGGAMTPYVGVHATFYAANGDVLDVDNQDIYQLGEGQTRDFELSPSVPGENATVDDYDLELVDVNAAVRNVR